MAGKLLMVAVAVASLAACSTIDKLTGQTDDTVLPGQREDAVPGKTQFPESSDAQPAPPATTDQPVTTAEPAPDCPPDDPGCAPPADDTFSDPQ